MTFNLGHVVGADGKGIVSIEKTGTSGLVDTYTITYTDDTTSTFEVTNGKDGSGGSDIVIAWETVLSDEKIPSEKLTKNTIDTKANATHTHGNIDNTGILKISGTAQASKNVVTDGTGKITVEAKPDLTNYLQKSQTSGLVKNDGSIDTSAYITNSALSNYLQKSQTSGLVKNDGSIDTNSYVDTDDVANNLTTTTAGKVLDARQGKALSDLIGDAITYINQ